MGRRDDASWRRLAIARRLPALGALLAALAAAASAAPLTARAFPPYRSTDAETAPPGRLELRAGLLRAEREDHDTRYTTPLLRVNLGIARNVELVSELEYVPEDARLGDGALGFKWAVPGKRVGVGVETLALLPVSSNHSGAGVESQLVATLRRGSLRLHANAGGFYDDRPDDVERGWRASLLGEWERGPARLGAELFAKQVHGEPVLAQAGPGLILSLGALDLRASLHAGLTSEAPDVTVNLWISTSRALW